MDRIGLLLTKEILDELDLLWPDRCPAPNDPELVVKCAQRAVINVLHARFDEANENPLDKVT